MKAKKSKKPKVIAKLTVAKMPETVTIPLDTYTQWTRFATKHGILVHLVNNMRAVVSSSLREKRPSLPEWKYIYGTLEGACREYEKA